VKLEFIGTRTKDFTVDFPVSGGGVLVNIGQPIEVPEADGAALIARDPALWRPIEEAEPAPKRKAAKGE
jgi:hypothetical protein